MHFIPSQTKPQHELKLGVVKEENQARIVALRQKGALEKIAAQNNSVEERPWNMLIRCGKISG